MSFENPVSSADQDHERAEVLKKVKKYFEEVLGGTEEGFQGGMEEEKEGAAVMAVLDAMDQEDYAPAFQHLEDEISRLKKRLTEVHESQIPKIEIAINDLEKLKDSLLLSEK